MTVLLWLAVPIAVTIVAWLLVVLFHRPEPPLSTDESIEERERFRQAMERELPRRRRRRPPPRT